MQIKPGGLYRLGKAACRLLETADMCRKAHIEFMSGRRIWVASKSLTDY